MPSDKEEVSIPLTTVVDGIPNGRKQDDLLPAPVAQPLPKPKASAATIIPIWIALSAGVIMYNKYIYEQDFKYTTFLPTLHLTFAAIGTRVLHRTTNLLDGVKDVQMTREKYLKSIVPIGVLFSGSLILSNTAYLHLSVAFIQMLKAFNPVAILFISFAFGLKEPNQKLIAIVLMISCGVSLASYGELEFDMVGFIIQTLAVVFESSRLVLIEVLLHGQKMDPLVSLYYFAPVCAGINMLILPFTDGLAPFRDLSKIGAPILLSNALLAFGLNIAAVFLVGAGSGLILTLAGVFKDILMIIGSVILFEEKVALLQVFGYSIALSGLVLFRVTGGK